MHIKKRRYEIFRVKEYFVIDPATRMATAYQLVNGQFEVMYSRKGVLTSKLLRKTFTF